MSMLIGRQAASESAGKTVMRKLQNFGSWLTASGSISGAVICALVLPVCADAGTIAAAFHYRGFHPSLYFKTPNQVCQDHADGWNTQGLHGVTCSAVTGETYTLNVPYIPYNPDGTGGQRAATANYNAMRAYYCPDSEDLPSTPALTCNTPANPVEKNAGDCKKCEGNPINPGTGNKYQRETDYVGPGPFPLVFTRVYNKAATKYFWMTFNSPPSSPPINPYTTTYRSTVAAGLQSNQRDMMAANWQTAYDRKLRLLVVSGQANVLLSRPDGRIFYFALAGGVWTADGDILGNLTRLTDGSGTPIGWQYVNSDDESEFYDTLGRLTAIANRSGITHTLIYPPDSDRPSTVTDSFGHTLSLTYDSLNRISAVTDSAGGVYSYSYDLASNLASITYPDSQQRTFIYNESANTSGTNQAEALTGILDESGARFATWTYNAAGRATSSQHANGVEKVSIAYDTPTTNKTTVSEYKDSASTVTATRVYTYTAVLGVKKSQGMTRSCTSGCTSASTASTFDANGNVQTTTDFNGNETRYTYDTRNLETARTEAYGTARARTISTQWHATFRLPTQIDEPGRRTTLTYDASGNVLTKTLLDTATSQSRTWTFSYNSYGQVLTVDGPRTDVSDVTTYTYYSCSTGSQCGQVQSITDAMGHVTTFTSYNLRGQPLTIQDANGLVTTLTYDARQRVTSRTVGSEVTTYEYWPTGLLKKITLPDASYLSYTYDAAHRLTQVQDQEGNYTAYTLDLRGNRTKEDIHDPASALTNTRTRVFNALNRLSQEIGAAGTAGVTTTYGQDNNGNETTINAPLSRNTTQGYDELNRLTQVTDPASGVTQYGYNPLDQLISVADPRNKVTSYTYNAFGEVTQLVSPDTGTTASTYDLAGNLSTKTDARGSAVTYSYDALNRVTQALYSDQTIQYAYDTGTNGLGRLASVSDNSGQTNWSYNLHGHPVSRQQVMGSVTLGSSVSYDSAGRVSIVSYPSGHYVQYGYANGKVASITLDGSTSILNGVLYEPFGPVSGWTWGNSTLAAQGRDLDGKTDYIDSAGLRTYSYDNAFRIIGITDASDSSLSQTYGYDLLDRLTSATGTTLNQSWTYDANSNRLTQGGSSGSTYSISSSSNRLTSVTGALTRSYTYDSAGNTVSDGSANFTYDQAGRMVSVTKGGITTAYSLNALGQRVRKTVASVSTYFFYDASGRLMGEYDNGGALIQEIVWLGDTPVASVRPNAGGAGVGVFYIHTDHLGAPTKLTRPNDNAIVWRWDRDPFGNGVPNEDPDGNTELVRFNLRFPGQYFDAETGLSYNYFRDYDPNTGRYVESDPMSILEHVLRAMLSGRKGGNRIPAELNSYRYALGNPIEYVDPSGLAFEKLPKRTDCKPKEMAVCTARCAPRPVDGCYVTLKWRLKGITPLGPIRAEERNVECNCRDRETELCGNGCKALIVGGLLIVGACASPVGAVAGGLLGAGAM